MKDWLDKYRDGEIERGLGLNVPWIDDHLSYKQGNFNVFAGHANVGKTYWILWYYMLLAVRYNLKFIIYSSENIKGVLELYLVEFYCSQKFEDVDLKDYKIAREFIKEHFDFVETDRLYQLPELMEIFANSDANCCLIDPHNSLEVPTGVNRHDYDYKMASAIRLFCQDTEKSLNLSAHGVTEALRRVHPKGTKIGIGDDEIDISGLTIPLQAADIEGGGKWVNRCDDLYIIHRYTQHRMIWNQTHIHVRKVKVSQTGGSVTPYDEPCKFAAEPAGYFTSLGTNVMEKAKQVNTGKLDI